MYLTLCICIYIIKISCVSKTWAIFIFMITSQQWTDFHNLTVKEITTFGTFLRSFHKKVAHFFRHCVIISIIIIIIKFL